MLAYTCTNLGYLYYISFIILNYMNYIPDYLIVYYPIVDIPMILTLGYLY
jgi:hypothetical protein